MNIQEKIQHYRNNLDLNLAKKDFPKLVKLEEEIRRNVKKALRHDGDIFFTSCDLRGLVLQIGKVLKAVNKRIEFVSIADRFQKHKLITDKEFADEMQIICDYIVVARELQATYSLLNYLAITLDLHEMQNRQEIEKDEQIFNDELLQAVNAFLKKESK